MAEKSEIETRPETKLPDQEAVDFKPSDTQEEEDRKVVEMWTSRFSRAETFRRPFIDRNIRMYKLYRAYRSASNYAYGTSLMPPTGFEIIETVKPRLASAEIKINLYPTKQENENSGSLKQWDDLIEYDLQVMEFDDKKIEWINAQLMFGNGIMQIMWDGDEDGDPYIEIVDNFLFYPDPQAMKRLKNSRWEIKQAFKSKAVIERDEKKRGEDPLYTVMELDEETGEVVEKPLIKSKKWEKIEEGSETPDDPRRQRYEINTLKMGQIDDRKNKDQAIDQTTGSGSSTPDKMAGDKVVEIWECWDHVEGKLVTIFNRKEPVRNDDNPYANVNGGQVFIDLPDITLNWEYYAMSHLEPVETTIHEIADSRNQAMDDIVFSLDPIRKVKKGQGYKDSDIVHKPGAIWYLQKADDVVIERGPEISRQWVEKDNLLRREIQTSLALSEYTSGIPKGNQEPASKVEILLMQTNIRFSLLVRQMEIAITELANALIQMNREFLGDEKSFRILGKKVRWGKFTKEDKNVEVDAFVDVVPKKEKTAEQEAKEVLEMYKLFVVDDKPEGGTPEEVKAWKKKKAVLQKLIVEKMGYDEYADVLAPDLKLEVANDAQPKVEAQGEPAPVSARIPNGPAEGIADNPVPAMIRQGLPGPEALIPPEGATTAETQAPNGGFLANLIARARGITK